MSALRVYVIEMASVQGNWKPMRSQLYFSASEAKDSRASCSVSNPDDRFRVRRYFALPQTDLIELRRRALKADGEIERIK